MLPAGTLKLTSSQHDVVVERERDVVEDDGVGVGGSVGGASSGEGFDWLRHVSGDSAAEFTCSRS